MIINPDALESYREVMEDETDAFIADILDSFYSNARELMAALDEAIAANDAESFARAAHTLKSTAATVGAERLSGLAADLEAKANAESLAALTPLTTKLKAAFTEAETKLQELFP